MIKRIADAIPKHLMHHGNTGAYLVTIDIEHREKYTFKGEDGKEHLLYTPKYATNNYLKRNINECTVVETYGTTSFKKGDKLIVDHWLFMDNNNNYIPPLVRVDSVDYFRVVENDVFFGIIDGEVIPKPTNLICEYISYNLSDDLSLVGTMSGLRRDVLKVTKVSREEKDYKVGDLIMIREYADYGIYTGSSVYVKVDKKYIWAKVEDEKIRKVRVTEFPDDSAAPATTF